MFISMRLTWKNKGKITLNGKIRLCLPQSIIIQLKNTIFIEFEPKIQILKLFVTRMAMQYHKWTLEDSVESRSRHFHHKG